MHSDIYQNRIHRIHAAKFSIALQHPMKRPFACAYFNFEMGFKRQEHMINSQDPATPQSNSFCLEINHSGETATGHVKLEIKLLLKLLQERVCLRSLVVISELEYIVFFNLLTFEISHLDVPDIEE